MSKVAPQSDELREWVRLGCHAAEMVVLKRPSAQAYPNTFVLLWKGPVGLTGAAYVCLDVHYEGDQIEAGKPLRALGGLWAKGIKGDLKPEQDHELRPLLRALVPDVSPDPTGLGNFGGYK